MLTTAPPAYWDKMYATRTLQYEDEATPFKELFHQYLPRGGTCFEVGCYPGQFLIYLGKHFGYSVSGMDTTPAVDEVLPAHIAAHGVQVDRLVRGDFFTTPIEERFDIVCSFGFIEHFDDTRLVIERHAEMVAPGGWLVLSAPNFRGAQWFLHRWLDPLNLSRHVVSAMNLRLWATTLGACGFDIVHAGYYGTFDFWTEDEIHFPANRIAKRFIVRAGQAVDRRIRFPTPWFSPYMILFARRRPNAAAAQVRKRAVP